MNHVHVFFPRDSCRQLLSFSCVIGFRVYLARFSISRLAIFLDSVKPWLPRDSMIRILGLYLGMRTIAFINVFEKFDIFSLEPPFILAVSRPIQSDNRGATVIIEKYNDFEKSVE